MTNTMVDSGLFGSPITSASSGFQPNTSEKSRLSHSGDDPGGGMMVDGNDANANSIPSKDAMRQSLKDVISRESFIEIQKMKAGIDKLSKVERLLLYLDLPSSLSNISDPLRQPLNPLGSRHEIQLTITWIKTHLEEDPQVSLPKHEV